MKYPAPFKQNKKMNEIQIQKLNILHTKYEWRPKVGNVANYDGELKSYEAILSKDLSAFKATLGEDFPLHTFDEKAKVFFHSLVNFS